MTLRQRRKIWLENEELLLKTQTCLHLPLPFTLVDQLGWLTPYFVAGTALFLYGIDGIGTEIESPFGSDWNDLRLDYFCHTMIKEAMYVTERNGGVTVGSESVDDILD